MSGGAGVPALPQLDASDLTLGIVCSTWHSTVCDALLAGARKVAADAGIAEPTVVRVPGSNELPVAIQALADRREFDALIALGVLIRGDTIHYELIADATTHALQRVALDLRTPVINGVVVAENQAQAEARCRGKIDRGAEFARAAIEMADLFRNLRSKA